MTKIFFKNFSLIIQTVNQFTTETIYLKYLSMTIILSARQKFKFKLLQFFFFFFDIIILCLTWYQKIIPTEIEIDTL